MCYLYLYKVNQLGSSQCVKDLIDDISCGGVRTVIIDVLLMIVFLCIFAIPIFVLPLDLIFQ